MTGTELQGKLEKLQGGREGMTPRGLNLALQRSCCLHWINPEESEQLFRVLLLSRACLASLAS